jgi:hypothetical protein
MIARAGAFGGTGYAFASDPTTSSAIASVPPPDAGHAPTHILRGVPLPVIELRDLAGRMILPSAPGGAHGVLSLRRFAPAFGWTRRMNPAA